jgi:hypothetical protein
MNDFLQETDAIEEICTDRQNEMTFFKIKYKKHKTTKERLIEFYGTNFDQKHAEQKEIEWGKPVGKEVW